MVPDTSQWRSTTAYDYFDRLPAAGLAWECLRRNSAYQADYAESLDQSHDSMQTGTLLSKRWGLRFRCLSGPNMAESADLLDPAMP